jgi:hypothetical protein
MTKHLQNLGVYAKAFAAFATSAGATVLILSSGLTDAGLSDFGLAGVAGAVTAAGVAITRNQKAIDTAGDLAADVVERFEKK